MLSDLSVSTYRPSGSLAIVNLTWIGIPIKRVKSQWRSWGEPEGSGFTCHCVRMQWVANANSTMNQHMQLYSLVHTLAELNENQRLSIQFQELFHITWCWRLSQHRKCLCKSTKPQQNNQVTDTQPVEEAHRSLQKYYSVEISKVVMCLKSTWFPTTPILTLRTAFATKSDS